MFRKVDANLCMELQLAFDRRSFKMHVLISHQFEGKQSLKQSSC